MPERKAHEGDEYTFAADHVNLFLTPGRKLNTVKLLGVLNQVLVNAQIVHIKS